MDAGNEYKTLERIDGHPPFHTSNPLSEESLMQLTAVFIPVPEGYVGFVEEIPGANTQGDTLEEARENLREALTLVLEANRELAEMSLGGQPTIREPIELTAP